MYSCKFEGVKTYGFNPENSTKSPSKKVSCNRSSSLSESLHSQSPLISRKPRSQRKRPCNSTKQTHTNDSAFFNDVFLPDGFVVHEPVDEDEPSCPFESKVVSFGENMFQGFEDSIRLWDKEEMEREVDGIMNYSCFIDETNSMEITNLSSERKSSPLRNIDNKTCWKFPRVAFEKTNSSVDSKKKMADAAAKEKKKNKGDKKSTKSSKMKTKDTNRGTGMTSRLLLKLNHEEVMSAWSNRSSPFCKGL